MSTSGWSGAGRAAERMSAWFMDGFRGKPIIVPERVQLDRPFARTAQWRRLPKGSSTGPALMRVRVAVVNTGGNTPVATADCDRARDFRDSASLRLRGVPIVHVPGAPH